jgi:hypothetical protein
MDLICSMHEGNAYKFSVLKLSEKHNVGNLETDGIILKLI